MENTSSNENQNQSHEASRVAVEASDLVVGQYPEHEKLRAKQHESHVLSGFLDMLDERRLVIASYHEHAEQCYDGDGDLECELRTNRLYDYSIPTKDQLIGLCLDIDPKKLSAEKDAMYQEIVTANGRRTRTP